MAKVKLNETELGILTRTIDIFDKSKSTVLDEFKNAYDWHFEIKSKWFMNDKDYDNAVLIRKTEDEAARSIVSKLNCISDTEWKKVVKGLKKNDEDRIN